jgi:hypothetical protein
MVRLEAPQRLLEHPHRHLFVPAMSADLGHQKHAIADALQSLPHPILGLTAMILPAVIKEGDPGVHGIAHHFDGNAFVWGFPEMMSSESEGRYLHIVFAKFSSRDPGGLGHRRIQIAPSAYSGIALENRSNINRRSVRWRDIAQVLRPPPVEAL